MLSRVLILTATFALTGCADRDTPILPGFTSLEVLQSHHVITDASTLEQIRACIVALPGDWTRSLVTSRLPEYAIELRDLKSVQARLYLGNDWISIALPNDQGGYISKNSPEKPLTEKDRALLLALLLK